MPDLQDGSLASFVGGVVVLAIVAFAAPTILALLWDMLPSVLIALIILASVRRMLG